MARKFQFIRTSNQANVVDASAIHDLARNIAELKDELVAGTEKAHATAVQVVYEQALTNATSDNQQASKVAHDVRTFRTQVSDHNSKLVLRGNPSEGWGAGDKNSPFNFAIGSEFGAHRDVVRRLKPRVNAGFGRVKNPTSAKYRDLPLSLPRRDTMLGWNQFHDWRGNRNVTGDSGEPPGYWLWPAVRSTREQVVKTFGTAAMKTVADVLNR